MGLRGSYTFFAPIYDPLVGPATRHLRRTSLNHLEREELSGEILISGIGSGLDIPHLPQGPRYSGCDLTPAMLERARQRARQHGLQIDLEVADAMALPYPDRRFDAVIMHLILAIVPQPHRALAEAARVAHPGGRILILDKFLKPGQRAPLRRAISPLLSRLATRTDVVFEQVLDKAQDQGAELSVISDRPVLGNGWFRHILLRCH